MVEVLQKTIWQFSPKLNIVLPYDPANLPLGIYPRELRTCSHKNLQIFIEVQRQKKKKRK
jgi:hypothetical protein